MDSKFYTEAENCCVRTTAIVSPPSPEEESPEEEDCTPEELEELEAMYWHPERHDCLWPLRCTVGYKFPVMVDTRTEYQLWCIGTVVSVDLVSLVVKFTFPGMCSF